MKNRVPLLRLLAEGVVVIGSILIAFAIDAWWDGRQAEAVEDQLLTSLVAGLEENGRLAAERAEGVTGDRVLAQRFIAMTAEEAALIPVDSTWVMLRALWRPGISSLNSSEIVAILDSSPTLLRDRPDLRRAMSSWRNSVASLETQDAQLSAVSEGVQHALAAHPEFQPALAQLPGARDLPGSFTRLVREDNDIMQLAARKVFNSQIQIMFLQRVAADAESALEFLRGQASAR